MMMMVVVVDSMDSMRQLVASMFLMETQVTITLTTMYGLLPYHLKKVVKYQTGGHRDYHDDQSQHVSDEDTGDHQDNDDHHC